MEKEQKNKLFQIIIIAILFTIVLIVDLVVGLKSFIPNEKLAFILPLSIYLVLYLVIGHEMLIDAFKSIFKLELFDENFLMAIASIGAFAVGEYAEGVLVLLLFSVGEWAEDYATCKSKKNIASLMDIRPDYANKVLDDGSIIKVNPEEIKVNDIIIVKPGEKIPLDGIIIKGESMLDTKALTGESLPKEVFVNDEVISGVINLTTSIEIKVLKEFHDSTVAKILELVSNASEKKSKSENFITKFSKWYTPIVVLAALLLAVIGGIVTSDYVTWITRSLNFLVVSCPCALVISVPLSFFAALGNASKEGILIKGAAYLERFNKANIFAFDKTGTLTTGSFKVTEVYPKENEMEIIRLAAIAEANSSHPIAQSIREYYKKDVLEKYELTDVSGKGIIAKGDSIIHCGNSKLMEDNKIDYIKSNSKSTVVYVAKNGVFQGYIVISDSIKQEAIELINYLRSINAKTYMLTGDNEAIASDIANKLSIDEYYFELLPKDKVESVSDIINTKAKNDVVCYLGDGINDAPVLMQADIGVSMGNIGSDAAIEASDIVLMNDDLKSIIKLKKLAKKTNNIVWQNIIFALGIKFIVLITSAIGLTNMWLAIFADVGVTIIAIINSLRANSK